MPGAVGVAEEGFAWQPGMFGELGAIIQRDGFGLIGRNGVAESFGYMSGIFSVGIIDDEQEARFAFDGGDEVVFLFFEVHEVGLPMVVMNTVVDVVVSGMN